MPGIGRRNFPDHTLLTSCAHRVSSGADVSTIGRYGNAACFRKSRAAVGDRKPPYLFFAGPDQELFRIDWLPPKKLASSDLHACGSSFRCRDAKSSQTCGGKCDREVAAHCWHVQSCSLGSFVKISGKAHFTGEEANRKLTSGVKRLGKKRGPQREHPKLALSCFKTNQAKKARLNRLLIRSVFSKTYEKNDHHRRIRLAVTLTAD